VDDSGDDAGERLESCIKSSTSIVAHHRQPKAKPSFSRSGFQPDMSDWKSDLRYFRLAVFRTFSKSEKLLKKEEIPLNVVSMSSVI